MAYNNDNTQNPNLGNPLTSNAAFVPSEMDRSQQQGHGLSHHDQYQQSSNPVSSHEHHVPHSGQQTTGSGMNNNFQAVPSSNTAGMTQGFAPVPQQHGHSGNHGSLGHDSRDRHDGTHQGHDSHAKHDKREDGGVVDALNPAKGGGMHLPHKGNDHEDHKREERHARTDDNFAYRTDPNHPNYEPQTHTTPHLAGGQHGATPLTQDPHHAGTRHNDGTAPFSSTTGGVHGDQTLLRDHHDSKHHDSSVAGSGNARGLSVEESRAHGSGPAYPDSHHGAVPVHAQHNNSDPNKRFDNPLKDGSMLQGGTTNTHGSHGTTGAYGTPSSHLPGQGGHTGQTLPGHNESNPLHKDHNKHDTTTGHGLGHGHDSTTTHGEHVKPTHNTFATSGHEPHGSNPAAEASHGVGHDSHNTSSHGAGGVGHGETAHKPTMGEKLKGSMAVLTGKMSGDQEKVAEGQALKTGQPLHSSSGVGSGVGHQGGVGSGVGGVGSGVGGVGHEGGVGSGVGGVGHQGGAGHESGLTGQHGGAATGGTQMGGLGAGTGGQPLHENQRGL